MDLETKAQGDFFEPDEHDREAVDEQKSEIREGIKFGPRKKCGSHPWRFHETCLTDGWEFHFDLCGSYMLLSRHNSRTDCLLAKKEKVSYFNI